MSSRKLPSGPTRMKNRTFVSALCLVFCLVFVCFGCVDIRVTIGQRPDLSQLDTALKVGESSDQDVLRILGEPYGKGKEMLPSSARQRELWTYYYEEGSFKDDRRMFVFIFFHEGRFDGYMWVSSLR
mgnify:CR=1 FL=1